jgi:hypothetical protein
MQSTYHLQFSSSSGNGLPLQGPNLNELPEEFTMVFWVYPFLLNPAAPSGTKSYFLNAFNRVQVYADNPPSGQLTETVHFAFTTGPDASDIVEPIYVPAN